MTGAPTRRRLAMVVNVALSFVLGVVMVGAVVLMLPRATDHRSLTVLTGSMRPVLEPGGVVVDRLIAPGDARIGDIVTFRDPERDRLVTHRLIGVEISGGVAHMTTRGDVNDVEERWSVALDGEIGRVDYVVPHLGRLHALIGGRQTYLGALIAIVALAAWTLVDLWRTPATPVARPARRRRAWRGAS